MSSLDRIAALAAAAEQADGAPPVDEGTWFALRHDAPEVHWRDDRAFAVVTGRTLTLVVHPTSREQGLGNSLLTEVLALEDRPGLEAWSHCDHPGAASLAARHGFEKVRELWVMRRPTAQQLPAVPHPEGIEIRSFRPGDEAELLRVNAAAFAKHPEQGAMDEANLAERMAEPWFDPTGLLMAVQGDRLLGFHWTKQHGPDLGEIYVIGLDPSAQGRGLGKTLSLVGLEHLTARGVAVVELYVEADNTPAIALYERMGFAHAPADTHVMYRR